MSERHGLGDPRIAWIVLLELRAQVDPEDLAGRLEQLAVRAGWSGPGAAAVLSGERRELLDALTGPTTEPLRLGLHEGGVVLAARHDRLDGLGMLAAAEHLLGVELRSSARGIDAARAAAVARGAFLRRGWEVLARPPARVAPSRDLDQAGDSFALRTLPRAVRTAELVHAGAAAVAAWNLGHGVPARRISVAIGVSTAGGTGSGLADDSAYLRLTDVERLSVEDVQHRLATAPVQPNSAPGAGSAATGALLRLAAPRLGSTLLVSHLGSVTSARTEVEPQALHPVSGGGSGVSLGAITVSGRTTLTLRSRAARHGDHDLERLLELVLDALG